MKNDKRWFISPSTSGCLPVRQSNNWWFLCGLHHQLVNNRLFTKKNMGDFMGDLTRLGKIGDTVNSLFSDTKPLLWFDRGSDKQLGWRSDGPGKSFGRSIRASFFLGGNIDGHSRILNWRYLPYIRPIFQAYVREYPHKIWPYMVQYLHFRILEFPLRISRNILTAAPKIYVSLCFFSWLVVSNIFYFP